MITNFGIAFSQGVYRAFTPYYTVEVNASYVNSTLPFIYYPLSFAPESFWGYVKPDGGNIRAYDSTGNRLAIEVVDIDKPTKTGAIHVHSSAWLDTTANTSFRLSYSNPSDVMEDSTSTYGSYNVYANDNYILNYNLTGANALKNRVSNNYHLTSTGTVTTDQTSPLEGYTSHGYDTTNGYDSYNDSTSGSPWSITTWPLSIETITKVNNTTTDAVPLSLGNIGTYPNPFIGFRFRGDASEEIQLTSVGTTGSESSPISATSHYIANEWKYLAGSRNDNTGTTKLYIDDEAVLSNSTTLTAGSFRSVGLGLPIRSTLSSGLTGNIATSLVSNAVRTDGYYLSRFYNLFRPDLFFVDPACTFYNTGYTLGATATNVASFNPDWVNPTNVTVDSTSTSTASVDDESSDILRVTSFGFAIPVGAEILGYMVKVRRYASATNTIQDESIKFVLSGTESGNNKATATYWSNTLESKEYGTDIDLWGTTYAYSDINNSAFGIDIKVLNTQVGSQTASIEAVWINVFYKVCT
jgi:hypothetical protein